MKLFLTSDFGGTQKTENGIRYACEIVNKNNFLENLKKDWPVEGHILILCSDPSTHEINDSFAQLYKKAFQLSNLNVETMDPFDGRNLSNLKDIISNYNILIFAGGHVPTENAFFQKIQLKEALASYDSLIIGISAGSMNCANIVYSQPELEGEALSSDFLHFIPGLGLTEIRILPHFQTLLTGTLDGLQIIDDIALKDSKTYPFYAIVDGSYVLIESGSATLYGEAYYFKNGAYKQIAKENDIVTLPSF